MRNIWRNFVDLFDVLPPGARTFYVMYSATTGLLALLDSAALALIVLTITPLVSAKPVTLPLFGELPQSATVWVILVIAALFILKGALALMLHWYATRRFANYELHMGDAIFANFIRSSWEERSAISTAELTRMVDISVGNASRGFLLPLSQVPGNALTFFAALTILVAAAPLTALIAFVYLLIMSGLTSIALSRKSRSTGKISRDYTFRVATIMTEMIDALKEVTLRDRLGEAGALISRSRAVSTRARANLAFITIVPRYTFEAALIGGILLVGGAGLVMGGPEAAVVSVSLFAASGFRMMPSLSAVQASITAATSNGVYVEDVVRELRERPTGIAVHRVDDQLLPSTPRYLELRDVRFSYGTGQRSVLAGVSMKIPFGSSLAIVGPSGAGKSTLIDILLGLSQPTGGTLEIDGIPLDSVLQQWRRRVGYVPQRVSLFDGTVAQNVALTWEQDYQPERVRRSLELAHVTELAERTGGIEARIGERGGSISGGQQQRLGIARALYTNPLVMVMDEATSSLDTSTENRIISSLDEFRGRITFITVAHRLATIREYDQVCYLEDGCIIGLGSFDQVIKQVPAFRMQAQLAGLIRAEG